MASDVRHSVKSKRKLTTSLDFHAIWEESKAQEEEDGIRRQLKKGKDALSGCKSTKI